MKQLIIARKDLNMSPGKLAAQVSHASMAFLTHQIQSKAHDVLKYPITQHLSFDNRHPGMPAMYMRKDLSVWAKQAFERGEMRFYTRPKTPDDPYDLELCEPEYETTCELFFDLDLYHDWIAGSFGKIVCEAKNKAQLLKAVTMAEELGLKENQDFFLIKDNCYTELTPEEVDEDGVGRTLTCIGFRPLPDGIQRQISRKYQLYK